MTLAALALAGWGSGPAPAPEAPVADAAMRGDTGSVRALLARGEDVNAAQGDGMTGLHWAAERGDAELGRLLVAAGADPGATTRLGAYTPLHLAARNGHADVLALLLDAGADPTAPTSTGGVTPLHFAARAGDARGAALLLDRGADPDPREGRWGLTPLMFAAAAGRTEVALALVERGADPAATARTVDMAEREREDRAAERERERRLAAERGEGEAVPERPSSGRAGAPSRGERQDVNERQRDRTPQPLSHAQLVGGYGGLTPLLLAVRDGRAETALALLEAGADVDQPSAGDGTTPLLMAAFNGHYDLALELLGRDADPNRANHAGAAPLYAVLNTEWIPKSRHPQPTYSHQQRATYLEVMRALLDAGADPNARLDKQLWFTTFGDDYLGVDRAGATPFWRAAYALDVEAMRLLVARGADPNVPTVKMPARRFRAGGIENAEGEADPSGLPPVPVGGPAVWPIHAASGVGYGEGFAGNIHRHVPGGWLPAARYLVEELGVDPTVRDHNGYNAIHHAASRGDNELILYLADEGVDVTAVSRKGQTTADMANGPVQRIPPFPATVALLERLGSRNNHNCVGC